MITQKDKNQIDQLLEDTFPSTHLPNGETSGAGTTGELPASQDSAGAATAPAALAVEVRPPMNRADQIMELGRMRECVSLLKEEIEAGWQQIIAEQQRLGWPDFDRIQDATHALHRATMDLDATTYEMVIKLRWKP